MLAEFDKLISLLEKFDAKGTVHFDIDNEPYEVVVEINGIPYSDYSNYINDLYNRTFSKIKSLIDLPFQKGIIISF